MKSCYPIEKVRECTSAQVDVTNLASIHNLGHRGCDLWGKAEELTGETND